MSCPHYWHGGRCAECGEFDPEATRGMYAAGNREMDSAAMREMSGTGLRPARPGEVSAEDVLRFLECQVPECGAAEYRARAEKAEKELALSRETILAQITAHRATVVAVVATAGGLVEGQPVNHTNYLQRLRALVEAEKQCDAFRAALEECRDVLEHDAHCTSCEARAKDPTEPEKRCDVLRALARADEALKT